VNNLIEEFSFQLSIDEVFRLLISEKTRTGKTRSPPEQLRNEVQELLQFSRQFIEPKALYGFFSSERLTPRFLFAKAATTALAICTIGPKLEKESQKLINEGALSQGVILDAIASCAAEAVAEETYQLLCQKIKQEFPQKELTQRFSPGYCRWTLEEGQKTIFRLLSGETIGVRLTPSFLMIPQKSVSFAINIGPEVDKLLGVRECSTCQLLDCRFRR